MNKKAYQYKLTLEGLNTPNNNTEADARLEFSFANHDDIFGIIARTKDKVLLEEPNDAIEFAVGLKLFTEVMLRNRGNALFEEFAPAVGAFMKKLKTTN